MTVVSMYLYYLLQKDLFTSGDSDETVALGLGYYAGMKSRNEDIRDLVMTDICPFSLGVDTHNESDIANPYFSPIISRNSVLPISKWDYYTTVRNNQREIELNIYQGDEYYAKNNIHLGKMTVKVKPRPAGEEKIKVRFTYDINGILDVDVEVESTHMTYQKTIVNKELGLSDKELQKQMEKLAELKKDPKSKEENQYLITLANALYRETSGDVRNYIAGIIDYFDRVLSEGNEAKIEHIRKRLMVVLSNIEAGLFDFSFDEREYEEEEYEEERMFIDSLKEELDTDEEQLYIRSLTKEPDEEEK